MRTQIGTYNVLCTRDLETFHITILSGFNAHMR